MGRILIRDIYLLPGWESRNRTGGHEVSAASLLLQRLPRRTGSHLFPLSDKPSQQRGLVVSETGDARPPGRRGGRFAGCGSGDGWHASETKFIIIQETEKENGDLGGGGGSIGLAREQASCTVTEREGESARPWHGRQHDIVSKQGWFSRCWLSRPVREGREVEEWSVSSFFRYAGEQ